MSKAPMKQFLVVEDNYDIANLVSMHLKDLGAEVQLASDGNVGLSLAQKKRFDLIILDLMLPGIDGLEICRRLRGSDNDTPILMLTAKSAELDRVVGLEMGADDYLPKPFNPRELLARIKSVLRRAQGVPVSAETSDAAQYHFKGWTLDIVSRQLTSPEGVIVALSDGEYRLLRVFLEHPNRTLSRDQLLDLTRGRESIPFDRSIDVQVGRVRKRLNDTGAEPEIIKTVRGEGYILAAKVERKAERKTE